MIFMAFLLLIMDYCGILHTNDIPYLVLMFTYLAQDCYWHKYNILDPDCIFPACYIAETHNLYQRSLVAHFTAYLEIVAI